jgi:alanyl-tRNA synthetase
MNANEIRTKYLQFMENLGHKVIPPAPLVLENDPTTLFTGSGMQPLLPYLLGQKHPEGNLLTNSQPCLRLQDIDDIGDPRHTTVFEMLGNWSLGGYFKEEQIRNFFTFLTKEIGLDPNKIFVTCFIGNEKYNIPRDDESAKIWQQVFNEVGIDAKIVEIDSAENGNKRGINDGERIFFYDDKENWWSRGGGIETTPKGDPCGPDSEVFYDFGEESQDTEKYGKSHPASDGARFMEIGNQVFMQYRRLENGEFEELEKKNVDFGGGLERITAASLNSYDVYKISLLKPIIDKLEEVSGKSYENNTAEMRIIADHLRGSYLLTAQGLSPSNKSQGYVLRRIFRRAILKALNLGIEQKFVETIIPIISENYSTLPDTILSNRDQVVSILAKEEESFRKTLSRGLKELEKLKSNGLTGLELFKLQDTYGFPLEISVEEAYRQDIKLSENWKAEFDAELSAQRERSKTAAKGSFKGGLSDTSETTVKYHTAAHLLLAAMRKLISQDIAQKGSNITPERLRFDFSVDHKLSDEELKQLETQVNEWIEAKLPVSSAEYDTDYALDVLKAAGSFRDRYPDRVTVYTVGNPDESPVSIEICGGPHVENTSVIGKFKITKEESSSAGVRRIKTIIE